MTRDLAHAIADILDALDECTWGDLAKLAAVIVIVAAIAIVAAGFAPDMTRH